VDGEKIRMRASAEEPSDPVRYERARREFSWHQARRLLDGLPAGAGLNIAHEAVDRHVAAGRGAHVALRCIAADRQVTAVTFAGLPEPRRTAVPGNRLPDRRGRLPAPGHPGRSARFLAERS
jgi:acetyl-CoA synthetase